MHYSSFERISFWAVMDLRQSPETKKIKIRKEYKRSNFRYTNIPLIANVEGSSVKLSHIMAANHDFLSVTRTIRPLNHFHKQKVQGIKV